MGTMDMVAAGALEDCPACGGELDDAGCTECGESRVALLKQFPLAPPQVGADAPRPSDEPQFGSSVESRADRLIHNRLVESAGAR